SGDHTKLNGFEQELYKNILVASSQLKTYHLPSFTSLSEYFPYSVPQESLNTQINPADISYSVDAVTKVKDSYLINGYMFKHGKSASGQKVLVGLKSVDNKTLFFNTVAEPRFDLNPYFKKLNLRDAGYVARIRFSDIEQGSYKVLLKIVKKDGETRVVETDITIEY